MPFLSPNQQRQSTEGVTAYNLQSKYNLQFTYRNRTNRAIISIRFHLPCCPVVSHFGHLPIRVAYSWLTRCLAKHTLREWANSYNAQNRAPVALIPLSVDISVSVCLSVCLRISTRYRPGGGAARRYAPPPMAVRRWQKSRRIYVRPRTGPQSAHLWWPAVAKLQAACVPIA